MDIFKSLVWDTLIEAAVVYLHAAFPWTAIPPISWIIDTVIDIFADAVYKVCKEVWDVESIVLRNEEHRAAYEKAQVTLKIIAKDNGIESEEFKNAREKSKADLSRFIRIHLDS